MSSNVLVFDSGAYHLCYGRAEEEEPEFVKLATETSEGSNDATLRLAPFHNGGLANKDRLAELIGMAADDTDMRTEDTKLFFTYPAVLTEKDKVAMCEAVFESGETNFEGVFGVTDSVLALYNIGMVSGVVLNIGYSHTTVVPAYEGYSIPHIIAKSRLSAQTIDNLIKSYIPELVDLSPKEMTDFKSKLCNVKLGKSSEYEDKIDYKLPCGQIVSVGNEVNKAFEALFTPDAFDIKSLGCPELIYNTTYAVDSDAWSEVCSNILVIGGTTQVPGLAERIKREVLGIMDAIDFSMEKNTDQHRVWKGGSVLGSLSSMDEMWISKGKYDEDGPEVIAKRKFLY